MSNLVEHAKRELSLFNDSDKAFTESLLKAVEGFASYEGHSGGSHSIALEILTQLLNFNNITPLTDDPEEWFFHGAEISPPSGVWQNKRNSAAFSHDGGKTYYLVTEDEGHEKGFRAGRATMYKSRPSKNVEEDELPLDEHIERGL